MSVERGPRSRGLLTLTTLALLAMVVLAGRVLAAPGDSDGSFSKDGVAFIHPVYFHPDLTGFNDLAIQPDGKIVLVGTQGENDEVYSPEALVARFNADGTPDTSFGKKGSVLVEFPAPDDFVGTPSVGVRPDGRILIATSGVNVDLAQLNPDGHFDASFSGDGKTQVDLPGDTSQSVSDLALRGDGRFVIGGSVFAETTDASDFMVARFAADGTLDPSFSGDGVATQDLGARDRIEAVALQADGSLVAAGSTATGFKLAGSKAAVARYTPAGDPDPSFSADGVAVADAANFATGVSVDGSGRIAISAELSKPAFAVVRLTPAGELDASFGTGGLAKVPFGDPSISHDLVSSADGSISVVGEVVHGRKDWTENDWAVARLDASGMPDRAFSGDGKRTQDLLCDGDEAALSVALDSAGRVVAGGICEGAFIPQADLFSGSFAVARYLVAAGTRDEDADNVADASDRCPGVYEKSRKRKGCPDVPRKVLRLQIDKHRHATGRLSAGDGACELDQKVSMLMVRRGRDQVVRRGRTDPDTFDLRVPRGKGSYYVVAAPKLEPDGGNCARARSKQRSIG